MSQRIKTFASCPENEDVEDVLETSEIEHAMELISDLNKRQIFTEALVVGGTCSDWIDMGMNFPIGTEDSYEYRAWKSTIESMAQRYNLVLERAREAFKEIIPPSLQPYDDYWPATFMELRLNLTTLHTCIKDKVFYDSYAEQNQLLREENQILMQEIKKLQLPINENVYTTAIKKAANQILTNFKNHKTFQTADAHISCFNDGKLIGKSSTDKALRYLTEDRKLMKMKDGCYKVIDASPIN